MNERGVELTWEGKHAWNFPPPTPQSFALKEHYSQELDSRLMNPPPDNRLYVGENLAALGALAGEFAGGVDCVYIDPPYNSQADYVAKMALHGDGGQILEQKQYGDRWDDAQYLQFMFERLGALRELLADTGSIFVHCDWHAAASLRLVCDEVFGSRNLLNEIVWIYGSGGGSRRRFGRKHDTILFYAKNARRNFFDPDAVRVPYRAAIAPKRRGLFHPEGMVAPDVWDIPRPPNHATSWVGYPTQKPLAVMERALRGACPPGGLVLDCFAGSGSTLVAAAGLGLRFIGVECAALGVHLARKRLVSLGASFGVWRVGDTHLMNLGDKRQPPHHPKPGELNRDESNRSGSNRNKSNRNGSKRWEPWKLAECQAEILKLGVEFGLEISDWRELVDWVATDPGYATADSGNVFAPTGFDAPAKTELIQAVPATGLSLLTTITGQDYFIIT
ncbi:site-specific DNA-methyltransferase [Mobiluncus mulieris]|uniref:DNA methyltransferase n=1 Tax=Mobiluncus mulieris TaxID=2052 RepID=UPI0021E1F00E|nr:site-specific DNA-methyltransferase [Mobiluncus mulieris]MCU9993219.1 site-specific DNA-methyltransferase [Mobiluncus mulieris]